MEDKMGIKAKFVESNQGTITDPENGLMWMKSDTWVELGRLITWHESQEYAREMNENKFAGFDNWHIPTASEAKLLFDGQLSNTDVEGCEIHIDPIFTSGCGFSTWTSETRGAKAAMGYDYRSDYEFWLAKENDGFPSAVRLVRKIQTVSDSGDSVRFVDNGDGTVADHQSGLMWKSDDSYIELDKWVTWLEAKTYVEGLNRHRVSGYTDWRMPTRKEIQTIYDSGHPLTDKYGDTVFLAKGFPPGSGITCWTKTSHKSDSSLAIRFHFYNGDYKWHEKGLRSHGVRAVRSIKD